MNDKKLEDIFTDSGGVSYDAVYGDKDYQAESEIVSTLIKKYAEIPVKTLLDVACGTGLHMLYLSSQFEVTGVDIAEEQVKLARQRLPGVTFVQADMRDFDLDTQFDAIICLFSSIAYVFPYPEFDKSIKNMARHLKPGGILLVEPWVKSDQWDSSRPATTHTYPLPEGQHGTITRRIEKSDEDGVTTLDMHFSLQTDEGTREFREVHKMAFCDPEEYRRAYEAAGLSMEYYEDDVFTRGLFIGRKTL